MFEPLSGPSSDRPSDPLYVPALPARRNALDAYDSLPPRVGACVTPLWSIPPRVGRLRTMGRRPPHPLDPDPAALAAHLGAVLHRIETVQHGRPAWVDAFHVEDQAWPFATAGLPGAARTSLRPVTGVGRAAGQQTASAEAARASGSGLGIRVFLTGLPDEELRDEVVLLLDRIAFAHCPLDLLLDLGAVVDEHCPAEKWALRALALLGPLHRWRTVVLLAGSFPPAYPDDYGAPLAEAQRFDWDVWHMLVDGPDRPEVRVVYGDYGADHTGGADRPVAVGGGSPWGIVRYTTERTFLLARVPTRGLDHADAIRALVQEIVCAEGFRGAEFSAGERWLVSCAAGAGSEGVGGPTIWLRTGHVQHMAQVVRALRRRPLTPLPKRVR
ncbi:beta family protein [Streptomyces sp. NBC_01077]|uniref:beta family protein n=1 Tax=Streptomyces sp. NBC_01077 TaxID=2903746 RepID=UPI00386D1217|nr:beta family protein [Streptomyces sp. NBC_01077]